MDLEFSKLGVNGQLVMFTRQRLSVSSCRYHLVAVELLGPSVQRSALSTPVHEDESRDAHFLACLLDGGGPSREGFLVLSVSVSLLGHDLSPCVHHEVGFGKSAFGELLCAVPNLAEAAGLHGSSHSLGLPGLHRAGGLAGGFALGGSRFSALHGLCLGGFWFLGFTNGTAGGTLGSALLGRARLGGFTGNGLGGHFVNLFSSQ